MVTSFFKILVKTEACARRRKRNNIALDSIFLCLGNSLFHICNGYNLDCIFVVVIGIFNSRFNLRSGVTEQHENLDFIVNYRAERLIRNMLVVAACDDNNFLIIERERTESGSCGA